MPLNTVEEPSIPQRLHPVGNSRFLAVAALCFLAFGLCLQGDFYMDDYLHIVEEEAVIPITATLKKKFLKVMLIPGGMIPGMQQDRAGPILHHI